jgi:hypothetical protein
MTMYWKEKLPLHNNDNDDNDYYHNEEAAEEDDNNIIIDSNVNGIDIMMTTYL